jgi:hypothetical protein
MQDRIEATSAFAAKESWQGTHCLAVSKSW